MGTFCVISLLPDRCEASRFLRRLVKQAKRKVFIIVDRHPVHRSKKVRQWLEKNAARIRLFFLPGYSPQLNPDEMLNQER